MNQKDFGIGTVHNTLADEGHDEEGTTTGASGGVEFNNNLLMQQINMQLK